MLKNPTGMKRNTSKAKFMAISHQVSTALLPDVSAGYCQRALVNESGIVRTQMGMHKRSEMVTVHGMPCVIPLVAAPAAVRNQAEAPFGICIRAGQWEQVQFIAWEMALIITSQTCYASNKLIISLI
jgi:hypothetical protein